MKHHLVNLLFEEYKQQCLFDELEKKGIEMTGLCVNNIDIIFDIIGFPRDSKISNVEPFEFSRDLLHHKYYELYLILSAEQKVFVSTKGLQIESGADDEKVKNALLSYINWLYGTFGDWKNGKLD